jgi:hypothetical protein
MKIFLTTAFAILLFTVTCRAQWTPGGSGTTPIYQTTLTNPVGIGTTTPDGFLTVAKSDNTNFTVHITNAGSTAKAVLISGANSGSDATLLQVTNFANTSNFFTVTDGNSYFENGNVGIGTTTPDALLALSKADNTNYNLHITNVGGSAKGALISGGNTGSDATLLRVTNAANTSNFFTVTDGNSYFENGNVGVGTTNPYGTLDVKVATDQHIVFSHNTNGTFANSPGIVCLNDANSSYTPLGFYASYYFFGGGNIGIGTQNPDSKLTVNGKVHSTEVLVDLLVTGPDYVFKKNYNLPSLAYVEAYTEKNHHLPDVPAAAEMKKNGINVAEMNMTLLKKVEELTLYMIELNKTVKEQQKEIERLKKGEKQ